MGEYLAHLSAAGLQAGHGHVTAARLAALVKLVEDGTVSSSAAKEVFATMVAEKAEPADVVEQRGLGQISDTAELERIVAAVVAEHPEQAAQYRGGKQQVLGFFVGRVMKASGGRANPKVVNELLRTALDA
jgi:aspartyl-tRNA(Asn)/glutamyl-tRNA(Gln) amidotransferase subunit B